MKIYIIILILVFKISDNNLLAQSEMLPKRFIVNSDSLPYLFKEPILNNEKKLPLIIWLHGSGENGKDNKKQYCNGLEILDKYLDNPNYAAFLCAPQCPEGQKWASYDLSRSTHIFNILPPPIQILLMSLVNSLIKEYSIDINRIYLIGLSSGGYGVWDLITRYPDIFAAGIPMCGGGDPLKVDRYCKIPIWAFHGDKDDVVKVTNSIYAMKAINENNCNKNSKLTVVPNEGHGVWNVAIKNPDLMNWLFNQKR